MELLLACLTMSNKFMAHEEETETHSASVYGVLGGEVPQRLSPRSGITSGGESMMKGRGWYDLQMSGEWLVLIQGEPRCAYAAGIAWSSSYMVGHQILREKGGSSYQISLRGRVWANFALILVLANGGLTPMWSRFGKAHNERTARTMLVGWISDLWSPHGSNTRGPPCSSRSHPLVAATFHCHIATAQSTNVYASRACDSWKIGGETLFWLGCGPSPYFEFSCQWVYVVRST